MFACRVAIVVAMLGETRVSCMFAVRIRPNPAFLWFRCTIFSPVSELLNSFTALHGLKFCVFSKRVRPHLGYLKVIDVDIRTTATNAPTCFSFIDYSPRRHAIILMIQRVYTLVRHRKGLLLIRLQHKPSSTRMDMLFCTISFCLWTKCVRLKF